MIYSILCKQCVTENCRHRGVWPANERCGSYSPNAHFKPIAEANAVARMGKASNVPGILTAIEYGGKTFIRADLERVEPKARVNWCNTCHFGKNPRALAIHCYISREEPRGYEEVDRWLDDFWDDDNLIITSDCNVSCPGWKGKE